MNLCECTDPGCPVHTGISTCSKQAVTTVYRVDMDDITGTPMCARCSDDAMESGVFSEDSE